MFISNLKPTLAFALGFSLVAAGIPPINSNIVVRNAGGDSTADTLKQIHRSLSSAILHQRESEPEFKESRSLDTSWNGAVLFLVEE